MEHGVCDKYAKIYARYNDQHVYISVKCNLVQRVAHSG